MALYLGSSGSLAVNINGIRYIFRVETPRINWILRSIASDGTPYNGGVGYKEGYRINSSGVETATANTVVSGFIPYNGESVELILPNASKSSGYNYLHVYDSNFNVIKKTASGATIDGSLHQIHVWESNFGATREIGDTTQKITFPAEILAIEGAKYIRVSAQLFETEVNSKTFDLALIPTPVQIICPECRSTNTEEDSTHHCPDCSGNTTWYICYDCNTEFCSECGYYEVEEECDHNWETRYYPIDDEEHYYLYYCDNCGEYSGDKEENTDNHDSEITSYSQYDDEQHYTYYECKQCEHTWWKYEPHNIITIIEPPTCESDGYREEKCEECGEVFFHDDYPPISCYDDDEDGYCDMCGDWLGCPGFVDDGQGICDICGVDEVDHN